jgi:hypothetical protein
MNTEDMPATGTTYISERKQNKFQYNGKHHNMKSNALIKTLSVHIENQIENIKFHKYTHS